MDQKQFIKRIDKELYDSANEIYDDLGTSVEAAFVMFLKKTVAINGLPFDLKLDKIPNEKTIAAINEDLSNAKRFSSMEALIADLENENE